MPDMNRDEVLSQVYRRLADREFASRLKAIDAEGNTPVVAAVAETSIRTVLDEVNAFGGTATVVAALFDGLVIFQVEDGVSDLSADGGVTPGDLDTDCTIGLLVARMIEDGGATHVFRCIDRQGMPHSARTGAASVVGSA